MYRSLLVGSDFKSTVEFGWLVASILILILGGYVGVRDRRARKWRDLYDLADTERKEVQHELDETRAELQEARAVIAEQKEVIAKLDALQMPVKIVEILNSSVERIDRHARERLEGALGELKNEFSRHDRSAEERSEKTLNVLEMIASRLGPDHL